MAKNFNAMDNTGGSQSDTSYGSEGDLAERGEDEDEDGLPTGDGVALSQGAYFDPAALADQDDDDELCVDPLLCTLCPSTLCMQVGSKPPGILFWHVGSQPAKPVRCEKGNRALPCPLFT